MINTKLFKRKIKYSEYNMQEIAKICDISYMGLYGIVNGKQLPSVVTAIKLSNLLEFDIKEMWQVPAYK